MTELRLYHREGAGRPPRVLWALEEAGAPYDRVVLSQEEGASDEHRLRHPLGRVPVLETQEGFLFESAALCLQIADLFPSAGLIGAVGSYERGLVYQWTVFAMSELEPAVIQVVLAIRGEDEAAQRAAGERLARVLDPIAAALERHDYLAGDRFSIADVVIGGVLGIARRYDALTGPSSVVEYAARLEARPARQRGYA